MEEASALATKVGIIAKRMLGMQDQWFAQVCYLRFFSCWDHGRT